MNRIVGCRRRDALNIVRKRFCIVKQYSTEPPSADVPTEPPSADVPTEPPSADVPTKGIDWEETLTTASEVYGPRGANYVRAYKQLTDQYSSKLSVLPPEKPAINWDNYKGLENQEFVKEMRKQYEAIKIPYPEDRYHVLENIKERIIEKNKEYKDADESLKNYIALQEEKIEECKLLPDVRDMRRDVFWQYKPITLMNTENPLKPPAKKLWNADD